MASGLTWMNLTTSAPVMLPMIPVGTPCCLMNLLSIRASHFWKYPVLLLGCIKIRLHVYGSADGHVNAELTLITHTPSIADSEYQLKCAGNVGAAADFVCRLECKRGLAEVAGLTNGMPLPPAGIFDPPYAINVGLNQQSIHTKVQASILHLPFILSAAATYPTFLPFTCLTSAVLGC